MNEAFRNCAELAYFLSGPALAAIALIALKQLRLLRNQIDLMKKDFNIRNERAAKEKAIEYTARYAQAMDLLEIYFHQLSEKEVPLHYKGPVGDFSPASIPKDWIVQLKIRKEKLGWIKAINELDTIATAFVTGVADEETGVHAIGTSFCANVEYFYDLISWHRRGTAEPHFSSTVKLYRIWSRRIEVAELEREKKEIEDKINSTPRDVIPTIGVAKDGT